MTIPGVSFYSSLLITAELGEIERCDEVEQAVGYAGLDPTVRESPDSRTGGGISRRGSGDLRWILVQCVNTAVHRCTLLCRLAGCVDGDAIDEAVDRCPDEVQGAKKPEGASGLLQAGLGAGRGISPATAAPTTRDTRPNSCGFA